MVPEQNATVVHLSPDSSTWKNYVMVLLAGAFAYMILRSGCGGPTPAMPVITSPKVIINQVNANEAKYKAVIESNERAVAKLQAEKETVVRQRDQARRDGKLMETVINNLPAGKDSTVIKYINNCNDRDSLADLALENVEDQITAKDNIIAARDSMYRGLRVSFDTLASQQLQLMDYTKALKRDIKKRKFGNFIWKAAAVVAGGLLLKQSLK